MFTEDTAVDTEVYMKYTDQKIFINFMQGN